MEISQVSEENKIYKDLLLLPKWGSFHSETNLSTPEEWLKSSHVFNKHHTKRMRTAVYKSSRYSDLYIRA